MKPNTQSNQSERLMSRPEMVGRTAKLPPINYPERYRNKMLPTPKLLNRLLNTLPELYRAAEVVGRWVWLSFDDVPAVQIRQQLSQLGFHWHRHRQAWQHPCGTFSTGSKDDPRQRYQSFVPSQIGRRTV